MALLLSSPPTMRALRSDRMEAEGDFALDVVDLQRRLVLKSAGQRVVAHPGVSTQKLLCLMGCSLYSAQRATHPALPFASACHFAPR